MQCDIVILSFLMGHTMDFTCHTKTLQALNKAMTKNTISLSHKLQRPERQWNNKQKTDLIDSLLRKYPVNSTYMTTMKNTSCSYSLLLLHQVV